MSIIGTDGAGPRTAAQILRDHLASAELSQRAAAKALGVDERTMRRYCAGTLEVPYKLLWAARYLNPIYRNRQVIAMLDSGQLSTSGDLTKAQFAAKNRKLLAAIEYLVGRRDSLASS